jgi:hypothetical protein
MAVFSKALGEKDRAVYKSDLMIHKLFEQRNPVTIYILYVAEIEREAISLSDKSLASLLDFRYPGPHHFTL